MRRHVTGCDHLWLVLQSFLLLSNVYIAQGHCGGRLSISHDQTHWRTVKYNKFYILRQRSLTSKTLEPRSLTSAILWSSGSGVMLAQHALMQGWIFVDYVLFFCSKQRTKVIGLTMHPIMHCMAYTRKVGLYWFGRFSHAVFKSVPYFRIGYRERRNLPIIELILLNSNFTNMHGERKSNIH